ncbi:MAG: class I SAM-dependent methyltransferase [Bdellovibrionota bacterium]
MLPHAVYGHPPADLCAVPAGALQVSPLVPLSRSLEEPLPALAGFSLLAPPGTIERRYALARLLGALSPGAGGTALAPKDKGGSRLAKELKNFGCEVVEEARHHHRICTFVTPSSLMGLDEAIAEGAPRFDEALGLHTQPGVFSWNRLDPGSALLLEQLPPLTGTGADLGCGIGFLSRRILESRGVRELHLLDIDGRAISAARKNITDPRAHFHWGDLRTYSAIPVKLDFVVTNPPFHDGGAEDQNLGLAFLRQAAYLLRAGGVCWVVANRHLPYEALLQSVFQSVSLKAESSAFKIYEAHR